MLEVFSPAKINLFLAIIEERQDGYHELLSLVAKLKFGDSLKIDLGEGKDEIICNFKGLLLNEDNFIIKAIQKFRERYAFANGVKVFLNKQIPLGAGLGGGSSNAVATIKGLNKILGNVLSEQSLKEIAVEIGSDCGLFLTDKPTIIRGKGDIIEPIQDALYQKLRNTKILIFKPHFSVNTTWAYEKMRSNKDNYIHHEQAELYLKNGINLYLNEGNIRKILYNNFEKVIFNEYKELKEIMKELREKFEINCLMSGSGSACFCILEDNVNIITIKEKIKEVINKKNFMIETQLI